MTPISIRFAVTQALSAAGSRGMSADELVDAVVKISGVPLHSRSTLFKAISDVNLSKQAVITSEQGQLCRHYTLHQISRPVASEDRPTPGFLSETFQRPQDVPPPRSITAAICGDPAPGRSALDQQKAGAR